MAWYEEGIRFQCQSSGQCCVSHGEFGYVYTTRADRRALARSLGLSTVSFTRRFCHKRGGLFVFKDATEVLEKGKSGACPFLKGRKCSVYEARPMQCRTWPFWPETLKPRAWSRDVAAFCPGVGKGRVWTKEEIQTERDRQARWESDLRHGR